MFCKIAQSTYSWIIRIAFNKSCIIIETCCIGWFDQIKIVKLDVDNNSESAVKYAIRSIPTLLILKGGEVQAQHIGAASKSQIQEFINNNI